MERRNWSLKALSELRYIDSLDSYEKADSIVRWYKEYLGENQINDFDLELENLQELSELFFKNINFLKKQRKIALDELNNNRKIKQFAKFQ